MNLELNCVFSVIENSKKALLNSKIYEIKLIQLSLLNFIPKKIGLIDLILFSIATKSKVSFLGSMDYINKVFPSSLTPDVVITLDRLKKEIQLETIGPVTLLDIKQVTTIFINHTKQILHNGSVTPVFCVDESHGITDYKQFITFPAKNKTAFDDHPTTRVLNSNENQFVNENTFGFTNRLYEPMVFNVNRTIQDLETQYDIDAVYGSTHINQANLVFRENIKVNINLDSNLKPLSKNYPIFGNDCFFNVNNVPSTLFGKIFTSFGPIWIHLIFPESNINGLIPLTKIDLYNIVQRFINTSINNSSISNGYTATSMFKDPINFEKEGKLNFELQKKEMGLFFQTLSSNQTIQASKAFFYYEIFGCKRSLIASSLFEALEKMSTAINPNLVSPIKLDVCMTFIGRNSSKKYFSIDSGFFDSLPAGTYHPMLTKSFTNYNKKLSYVKDGKLHYLRNGTTKVNFYNGLVSELLPENIRKVKYPQFAFLYLTQSLLELKKENKQGSILIDSLKKFVTASNISSIGNHSYRMELTSSLFGIIDSDEFYRTSLNQKKIVAVDSAQVSARIHYYVDYLIGLFTKPQLGLNKYSHVLIVEVLIIEFLLRGGANLHLLPKRFKNYFDSLISNGKNLSLISLNNMPAISQAESVTSLLKLTRYKSKLGTHQKEILCSLIRSFLITDVADFGFLILDSYIKEFEELYEFPSGVLEIGTNFENIGDKIVHFKSYFRGIASFGKSEKFKNFKFYLLLKMATSYHNMDVDLIIEKLTELSIEKELKYLFCIDAENLKRPGQIKIVKFEYDENRAFVKRSLILEITQKLKNIPVQLNPITNRSDEYGISRIIVGLKLYANSRTRYNDIFNDVRFGFTFTLKNSTELRGLYLKYQKSKDFQFKSICENLSKEFFPFLVSTSEIVEVTSIILSKNIPEELCAKIDLLVQYENRKPLPDWLNSSDGNFVREIYLPDDSLENEVNITNITNIDFEQNGSIAQSIKNNFIEDNSPIETSSTSQILPTLNDSNKRMDFVHEFEISKKRRLTTKFNKWETMIKTKYGSNTKFNPKEARKILFNSAQRPSPNLWNDFIEYLTENGGLLKK
ncbi:hypothetical protein BB559_002396 [Furculomyces boomerangus]|uniref:Uncharacterized protein n=1 Tax=Furculomyces boomerangus TaxID=61424 RepID=A0A2T9YVN4_9FUNG|nr:hypothetical protein BB559_002396 [Furculomyces boomerangus]